MNLGLSCLLLLKVLFTTFKPCSSNFFIKFSTTVVFPTPSTPSIIINWGTVFLFISFNKFSLVFSPKFKSNASWLVNFLFSSLLFLTNFSLCHKLFILTYVCFILNFFVLWGLLKYSFIYKNSHIIWG